MDTLTEKNFNDYADKNKHKTYGECLRYFKKDIYKLPCKMMCLIVPGMTVYGFAPELVARHKLLKKFGGTKEEKIW